MNDQSHIAESASVRAGVPEPADGLRWRARWEVKKYASPSAEVLAGRVQPIEVVQGEGNLAMNGGMDVLWKRLITNKPTTAANSILAAFSSLAAIAVGQSSATSTASQTNLQGTNTRGKMDAGYPTHTTGTSTAARSAVFRRTFTTAQANFAWKEWGVFNTTSTGANAFRMLNRKVQALGTKTSAATWQFTVTLTIS